MKKYLFATFLIIGFLSVGGYLKIDVYSNHSSEKVTELESVVNSNDLSVLVIETNWCGWCDAKFQNESSTRDLKGYRISAETLESDMIEKYGLVVPSIYLAGEGKLTKLD